MSQSEAPAADWYQDPSGRFQFRYWDGETWTGHVSTDGETEWDPPTDEPDGGSEDAGVEDAGAAGTDGQWAPEEAAASAEAAAQPAAESAEPVGGAIEEGEPSDANLVANSRAGVDDDIQEWVDEVAAQVDPRLSRINRAWTSQPQAEAARACAYGLLLGHLAHLHPHMRGELSQVAEAHPSFTTLEAGSRLETLEQIAGDPQRSAAWLGPLIGEENPDQVRMLFD
ncbi:DUF2510 domain-containing protein [Euzebya tangerina]|uniref:DUF2510 domain-containing protein n=1 Tax=Euzebya tangerina TaxID=591198 RepID=UPI000E3106AD|nr:DUF2510 domain-containing protein [Euzebya tangerina]